MPSFFNWGVFTKCSFKWGRFTRADLRAADLSGVEIEHLHSIAGADFSLVQGLSEANRAKLLSRSSAELDVWNPYTRQTTRQSLEDR
jgi:hypothetical protein